MKFKEWAAKDSNYILIDVWNNAEEIWDAATEQARISAIQDICDHDFEDIGGGKEQCTYPECQIIRAVKNN